MAELQAFPLVTKAGATGSVFRRARFLDRAQENRVRLDDGREFDVPSAALEVQPDGSFLLNDAYGTPEEALVAEPAGFGPRGRRAVDESAAMDEGLRADDRMVFDSQAADSEMKMDEPLYTEQASVERVAVNRIVDAYPQVREEGDTTVVPVVEEVLIIQKRLMLKEEVRITRKRVQLREPRRLMADGAEVQGLGSTAADSRQ
jgi:hypothetical protein